MTQRRTTRVVRNALVATTCVLVCFGSTAPASAGDSISHPTGQHLATIVQRKAPAKPKQHKNPAKSKQHKTPKAKQHKTPPKAKQHEAPTKKLATTQAEKPAMTTMRVSNPVKKPAAQRLNRNQHEDITRITGKDEARQQKQAAQATQKAARKAAQAAEKAAREAAKNKEGAGIGQGANPPPTTVPSFPGGTPTPTPTPTPSASAAVEAAVATAPTAPTAPAIPGIPSAPSAGPVRTPGPVLRTAPLNGGTLPEPGSHPPAPGAATSPAPSGPNVAINLSPGKANRLFGMNEFALLTMLLCVFALAVALMVIGAGHRGSRVR